MNRAERRQKIRDNNKKIYLTKGEIEKIKEQATDEAFTKVFKSLYALPFVVLMEKYGFGKKRLQKFNDRLTDVLKEVEKGEKDLVILENEMKKYGIEFRRGDDN